MSDAKRCDLCWEYYQDGNDSEISVTYKGKQVDLCKGCLEEMKKNFRQHFESTNIAEVKAERDDSPVVKLAKRIVRRDEGITYEIALRMASFKIKKLEDRLKSSLKKKTVRKGQSPLSFETQKWIRDHMREGVSVRQLMDDSLKDGIKISDPTMRKYLKMFLEKGSAKGDGRGFGPKRLEESVSETGMGSERSPRKSARKKGIFGVKSDIVSDKDDEYMKKVREEED